MAQVKGRVDAHGAVCHDESQRRNERAHGFHEEPEDEECGVEENEDGESQTHTRERRMRRGTDTVGQSHKEHDGDGRHVGSGKELYGEVS